MDPNEALRRLRALVATIRGSMNHYDHRQVDDLIETFDALDDWLTKGGFLPATWMVRR